MCGQTECQEAWIKDEGRFAHRGGSEMTRSLTGSNKIRGKECVDGAGMHQRGNGIAWVCMGLHGFIGGSSTKITEKIRIVRRRGRRTVRVTAIIVMVKYQ